MSRRPARLWPALLTTLLEFASACDGRGRGTRAPSEDLLAAGWIDSETVGAATEGDADRLERLGEAGPRGRLLRLDRLLDLYDGARFGQDEQARDNMWMALGGYVTEQGIDASREAVLRMLDEGYALEDLAAAQPGALTEDEQQFVADAIMLLSTDMFLPDSAEALITQTLAYRVLAETGHPRIADNAHWRLYDHVRGVLDGAIGIGPELRPDIIVHALYVEREDVSAWLEDLAPHAQPPLPSADELWQLLEAQRDAIASIPRWQPVLAARAQADAELRETVVDLLPRPRDPAWVLPELPRGTGQRESLAPVVLLADGKLILEPTSGSAREQPAGTSSDEAVAALEALLVRDGRGTVLFAADPHTPAPEFNSALAMLLMARATTIELAVHEPRIDGQGSVVVALPLYVARQDDLGPGTRALRDGRLMVQLTGRGPRFRGDGRWLSSAPVLPSDVQRFAADLRRAYPSERVIGLSIADDVQPGQLVDLLAALTGGIDPLFFAVGWLPDLPVVPSPAGDPVADRALSARLALVGEQPTIALQDGAALTDDDRARVEQASARLRECVPELETALPRRGVKLDLEFLEGKLTKLSASAKRVDAAALARLQTCASERLLGLRLREAEQPLTVTLSVRAGAM